MEVACELSTWVAPGDDGYGDCAYHPTAMADESILEQASRIRARRPSTRHADRITVKSRYGEQLTVPRELAAQIGDALRRGRPWAIAAESYWGSGDR